jgi:hypothetical protein
MRTKTWWKKESEEIRALAIFGAMVAAGILAGSFFMIRAILVYPS